MPTFGEMVKKLRKEHGLTQTELAENLTQIGDDIITRSAVSMWEAGNRRPKFEVLEAIADYFNVDMEYLLGRPSVESARPDVAHAQLIQLFDSLPPASQEAVLVQLRALSQFQKGQGDQ